MQLVSTHDMYQRARQNGYAIAGFAAYNLETLRALIETADALRAPVIVQTTPSNIDNMGIEYLVEIVRIAARQASVPVVLHLDHGDSVTRVEQCVRHGFTSVMIDGSSLPYEENIRITREAVAIAHAHGVSVESELGHVAGVEDEALTESAALYTDPALAADFISRSGADSLAIAIGTAHGVYRGEPKLDFERLSVIHSSVAVPLVLHGASGVPDASIREAVRRGVAKINIATELKIPYADGLRRYLLEHPEDSDPRKYSRWAVQAYTEVVGEKIRLVAAAGKY